jgi:hypothetical protein
MNSTNYRAFLNPDSGLAAVEVDISDWDGEAIALLKISDCRKAIELSFHIDTDVEAQVDDGLHKIQKLKEAIELIEVHLLNYKYNHAL